MCASFSNQKFDIALSTRPLSGIGSGKTTSKALSRPLCGCQSLAGSSAVEMLTPGWFRMLRQV